MGICRERIRGVRERDDIRFLKSSYKGQKVHRKKGGEKEEDEAKEDADAAPTESSSLSNGLVIAFSQDPKRIAKT